MAGKEILPIPQMLLLGSEGRNSGKTVLACRIIDRLQSSHSVVGLKVSTIHTNDRKCLRGGKGCGVCTSLEGDYCVSEEDNRSSGKDTSRMLAAGAAKVYWLRARKGYLKKGLESFIGQIPTASPIVCESNSLRGVVEPGVFAMMKQKDSTQIKSSAAEVQEEADLSVSFDGHGFDYDADSISFDDRGFTITWPATLVLLAGGGSRRMGRPKSALPYGGVSLLEHICSRMSGVFSEVLISANSPPSELIPSARVVADRVPGYGPIGGISAALESARYHTVFVTACDIPTIHLGLVASLLRKSRVHDIVVPRTEEGFLEPLHATYNRRVLPYIDALVEQGEKRIRLVYDRVDTCYIDMRPDQRLVNINTPEEYRQAAELAAEERT